MLDECLDKVGGNSFDLVLIAAKRAHQLSTGGHKTTLEGKGDKPSVIALREIEAEKVDKSILETSYDFSISDNQNVETMNEVNEELSEQVVEEGSLTEVTDTEKE